MKKLWAKRLAAAVLAGGTLMTMNPSVDAADIRILPVDTAKFWAGAHFDFDVEVSQAQDLKDVKIQVNGKDAGKFFGQPLTKKDLGNGVTSYRVNQVSFPQPGSYKISVEATDKSGNSVEQAG